MSEVTEDMIGCLCKFWDNDKNKYIITVLTKISVGISNNKLVNRYNGSDWWFDNCRPVKPDEIRFANVSKTIDHIGDDNDELTTKCSQLENDVKTLKEVLLKQCPEFEEWVNKNFEVEDGK